MGTANTLAKASGERVAHGHELMIQTRSEIDLLGASLLAQQSIQPAWLVRMILACISAFGRDDSVIDYTVDRSQVA